MTDRATPTKAASARWTTVIRRRHDLWELVQVTRALLRQRSAPPVSRVLQRMEERAGGFLAMVERTVFAVPDSPYRPLFAHAGYDLERVRALVGGQGLEPALETLAANGVYVTIEEFKGRKPLVRGSLTLTLTDTAFRNPLVRTGLVASSGGTRSKGIPTIIPVENLKLGAEHLALALDAYGLEGATTAVWLPFAHGASLWAILAFAAAGRTPREWFTQFSTDVDPAGYWYARYWGLRVAGALLRVPFPRAQHIPIEAADRILTSVSAQPGPWVILTTPSFAIRLAIAAKRMGRDLDQVTFITIGEPLTAAKMDAITRVGGRAFSSLGFTEFGRATYGCARPQALDDGHVCLDAVAVIQRVRTMDRLGAEVPALLFTALSPEARKILVNMETGDYATMVSRRCGCPLDRLGWSLHLCDIRSFEKLNAEGQLFFGSQLITLVEETLPQRFGGDATDYQLVEHEDADGITRMAVRVHPRLGRLDERAILDCVEDVFAAQAALPARVWAASGTLTLHRAEPIITRAGKSMPLHHLG